MKKFRIVLLFCEDDKNKLIELNKKINENIEPDIIFSKTQIPHITLASGYISNDNLNIIEDIIKNLINIYLINPIKLNISNIEFSSDNEWAFLNIELNKNLENFTINMRENIQEYIELSARRKTHITIAKSKQLNQKIELIKELNFPKTINISSVAIGLSGENGTLINIEKEIKLIK